MGQVWHIAKAFSGFLEKNCFVFSPKQAANSKFNLASWGGGDYASISRVPGINHPTTPERLAQGTTGTYPGTVSRGDARRPSDNPVTAGNT